MRLLLLTALVLAACAPRPPPLSSTELIVRMAAAERGEDLSRALVCGADQALVNEFALKDPPPRVTTHDLARLYRATIVQRVRDDEALRGASVHPESDECIAIRRRADLAALWRDRPTGREQALARQRGR
jgi:hypothetical protein